MHPHTKHHMSKAVQVVRRLMSSAKKPALPFAHRTLPISETEVSNYLKLLNTQIAKVKSEKRSRLENLETRHFTGLQEGLDIIASLNSSRNLSSLSPQDLVREIKASRDKTWVLETFEKLYFQDRLTRSIMLSLILNKSVGEFELSRILKRISNNPGFLRLNATDYADVSIAILSRFWGLKKLDFVLEQISENLVVIWYPLLLNRSMSLYAERSLWRVIFGLKKLEELDTLIVDEFLSLAEKSQFWLDPQRLFLAWESSPTEHMLIKNMVSSMERRNNFTQEQGLVISFAKTAICHTSILLQLRKLSIIHQVCTRTKFSQEQSLKFSAGLFQVLHVMKGGESLRKLEHRLENYYALKSGKARQLEDSERGIFLLE